MHKLYSQTNEWRKLHDYELQCGGHAWREEGSLVRQVIEENI